MGRLLQWIINVWIATTGKRLRISDHPWIEGPIAKGSTVGDQFYQKYADDAGLRIGQEQGAGLLQDFSDVLLESDVNRPLLNERISGFYEHTADHKLDVWSQWSGPMSFFAQLLIRLLSTRIEQMNLPLSPLETSHGMSSQIITLSNAQGQRSSACWLRKSVKSGKVVYAGFYSACYLPAIKSNCVKVVFPVPKGNVTVILKVQVQSDGSVKLLSHGKKIGEPGYYRTQVSGNGRLRVKYLPLKEEIHVFEDHEGVLRTDHKFWFLGSKFLELHYKIA